MIADNFVYTIIALFISIPHVTLIVFAVIYNHQMKRLKREFENLKNKYDEENCVKESDKTTKLIKTEQNLNQPQRYIFLNV